jgi:hypothetical protein
MTVYARRWLATGAVLLVPFALVAYVVRAHSEPDDASATPSRSAANSPATLEARLARKPGRPGRLYSARSPFNRRIPSGAVVDPNSNAMVQQLAAEVTAKGWAIATKRFTPPIFYANARTRKYNVRLTHPTQPGRFWEGVPIPNGAFASQDSDGLMTVIDRSKSCEYDFGRPQKAADGTWTAYWLNATHTTEDGVYDYDMAVRASGFATAAGLITPREMRAGVIQHALVFTMTNGRAGGPVAPATQSDGRSSLPGAIPQGARVQLDPSLNLDTLGLTRWQKTIARALQQYGMFLADTGGAVAIFAQHAGSTGGYVYPWGDVDYGYLPPALAKHLRVLKLGRQLAPVYKFVPTRCMRLR